MAVLYSFATPIAISTPPLAGEKEHGGHAMTLVGYQDDPGAPGGGYFLVRNSWQPWSWDGVWQTGYGCIPYAYISRYASAVISAYRITGADICLRDSIGEPQPRPRVGLTWNSPDIWLRRSADGGDEPQTPHPRQPNALYVRATNRGPACAYAVQADVFFAPVAPTIRATAWQRAGRLSAGWLKPGETVLGPLSWTPPDAGPYALLARLSSAGEAPADVLDPAASDNLAQRNLWQANAPAGGAIHVRFELASAPGKSGAVSVQVDRGDLPAAAAVSPINIGPALPAAGETDRGILDDVLIGASTGGAVLGLGQGRRASLTVTLPANAPAGARYTLGVVQKQGDEVVGRLTVQVDVGSAA